MVDQNKNLPTGHSDEPNSSTGVDYSSQPSIQSGGSIVHNGETFIPGKRANTFVDPKGNIWAHNREGEFTVWKRKDYWGITPILMSLLLFLGFIVVAVVGVSIWSAINIIQGTATLPSESDTNETIASVSSNPWLIVASTLPMYAIWVAVAIWVSKYRSQVGYKFKTTWEAFRSNFRLRIKWYDVFIGLGVSGAFILLQAGITWLIETFVTGYNESDADNTQIFANLNGAWFFILGFGLVGIVGPIMEEIYFRGLMLRGITNHFEDRGEGTRSRLAEEQLYDQSAQLGTAFTGIRGWLAKHKDIVAITITAIIFGSFHFQSATVGGFTIVLITGSLGWVLGYLTIKLNRIAPAMFAHMFNNTIAITLLLLS